MPVCPKEVTSFRGRPVGGQRAHVLVLDYLARYSGDTSGHVIRLGTALHFREKRQTRGQPLCLIRDNYCLVCHAWSRILPFPVIGHPLADIAAHTK